MSVKSLSIIIPCYNEEARIISTWNKIIAHSSAIKANVKYVFVNDGSTDNTLSLLTSLTENSDISTKIVSYEDNKGKGYSVKQGVMASESDYYLIMDADGATNMKEINTFLEHTEKADIIIGSRIGHLQERAIYKRVLGQIAHTIITTTLGLKVKDTQCGFKMFSNSVKYIWNEMKLDRRGFDFELLYLAKKHNIDVLELSVDWHDVSGSKIKMVDYLKTLEELVVVYKNHKLAKIEKYIDVIKKDALRLGFASLATVVFGLNFFAGGVLGDNGGGSGSGSSGGSSFTLTTYEAGTMPDTTSPTKRINVGNSGEQDNGGASVAGGKPNTITPDGRYIVFESNSTNFIGGANNGTRQVWIRDVLSGTTTLISQTMSGGIPNASASINNAITSDSIVVAADGRYVFFSSTSSELVSGSNGSHEQVYLRNVFSGTTTLISADNSGNEGDNHSQGFGMSSGGRYILFKSQATNLVSGDVNGLQDAFVRDVFSGITLPLNIALNGNIGTGESTPTMMTPDGRYMLFDSNSVNLVSGVNNGVFNVFVRDMWSGTTTLVTRNNSGALANIDSQSYSITPDGRYVLFKSYATNLVPGDTNGSPDIFVRDMLLGTTTLVNSNLSNGFTSSVAAPEGITSDGRLVLFYSDASDLVAGDTNNTTDTFVRDVFSGVTTRVNVGNQGEQDNAGATALGVTKMTPDGRYVFFMSNASDLVTGDTNNTFDVFIRDRLQNSTKLVSKNAAGVPGNFLSYPINITPNGKNIIFYSLSSDLVSNDTNNLTDAFLYDPEALIIQPPTIVAPAGDTYVPGYVNIVGTGTSGSTIMVGVSGTQYTGIISANGSWQLPPIGPLGNGIYNISAKQIDLSGNVSIEATGTFTMVVSTPTITSPTTNGHTISTTPGYIDISGIGTGGVGNSIIVVLSGVNYTGTINSSGNWSIHAGPVTNGSYDITAYEMDAYGNVGPTDSITIIVDGTSQLPIFSGGSLSAQITKSFTRINISSSGDQDNGVATFYDSSMTSDGKYVLFNSDASSLAPNDSNGLVDVFVRNVLSGTTTLVSASNTGLVSDGVSIATAITPDGRYVLFRSAATNLVTGDTNGLPDIFVRDMLSGNLARVSVSSAGIQGDNDSEAQAITPDGRYVLFSSNSSNFFSGDTNGFTDVFVRNMLSGTTSVVSLGSSGTLGDSNANPRAITPDGRYVLFDSSSQLTPNALSTRSNAFVRDMVSGSLQLVSLNTSGNAVQSTSVAITPDGRYVLLSIVDTTGSNNGVIVRDTLSGTTIRVSVDNGGNDANASSTPIAITPDGRYVLFSSLANNLALGDTNNGDDIFVRDVLSGITILASSDSAGIIGNDSAYGSAITPDGRYVVFSSFGSNFVAGDTNSLVDAFVKDIFSGAISNITINGRNGSSAVSQSKTAISSGGRYVLIESSMTNLVPNDTNNRRDVFLYDTTVVPAFTPTIVYPAANSILTPGLSDHIIGTGTAGNIISVGFSGSVYTGLINGSGYWSVLVGPLAEGIYTIQANQSDGQGNISATTTTTFIAASSTCNITVSPSTGVVGDTISIEGIAQISGAVFSGFNWGDSSSMVANASWYATGSHIYSSAGTYSIIASMKYIGDSSSAGLCAATVTISAATGQNQTGGNNNGNNGGGGGGGGGSYGYGGSTATGGTNPWTTPTLVTGTIQPPLRQLVPGPVDVGGIVNSCGSLQGENAQSYCFARNIGTTTQDTLEKAAYTREITREELAKVMTKYAIKVMKKVPDTTRTCTYIDTSSSDVEMKGYIQKICQLGLMGVDNNGNAMETFRPKANITRGEYMTVLSRMLYGRKYDVSNEEKNIVPFYEYHMANLIRQNIFTQKQPERQAQRYEIFYTLYRLGKSLQK